ncbi:MAG: response regulator, partial [Clostridia bacterium]
MENKPMTILLIEDDELECQKFKSYIETVDNVKIIGTTNSSDEGLEYFKTYLPEAIVLDIELHKGQGSGIEFIDNAKKFMTDFKPIIVVTTNASSSILYDKLHEEGVDLIFYKKQTDYSPKLII